MIYCHPTAANKFSNLCDAVTCGLHRPNATFINRPFATFVDIPSLRPSDAFA